MSGSPGEEKAPLVDDFDNYRDYFKELLEFKKKTVRGFSLRWLAKKANIQSVSYITKVINGNLSMSPSYAIKYLQALEVPYEEQVKLRFLLNDINDYIIEEIENGKIEFIKQCIFLLLSRSDFVADESWLYKQFCQYIPKDDISFVLDELIQSKQLQLEDNKWIASPHKHGIVAKNQSVSIPDAINTIEAPKLSSTMNTLYLQKDLSKKFVEEINHSFFEVFKKYQILTEETLSSREDKDENDISGHNIIATTLIIKKMTDY